MVVVVSEEELLTSSVPFDSGPNRPCFEDDWRETIYIKEKRRSRRMKQKFVQIDFKLKENPTKREVIHIVNFNTCTYTGWKIQ